MTESTWIGPALDLGLVKGVLTDLGGVPRVASGADRSEWTVDDPKLVEAALTIAKHLQERESQLQTPQERRQQAVVGAEHVLKLLPRRNIKLGPG